MPLSKARQRHTGASRRGRLSAAVFWLAATVAAAPACANDVAAPAGPAVAAANRLVDLDLSAFYRGAAAKNIPAIMLQSDLRGDAFVVGETRAFAAPDPRPRAFGHIIDLPKSR